MALRREVKMVQFIGSTEAMQDAGRRLARRHIQGVDRYSQLLTSYGDGKIAATAFGKGLFDLAIGETARYAADVVDLGTQYWNWLVGSSPERRTKPAPKSRHPKRRRARKTTAKK